MRYRTRGGRTLQEESKHDSSASDEQPSERTELHVFLLPHDSKLRFFRSRNAWVEATPYPLLLLISFSLAAATEISKWRLAIIIGVHVVFIAMHLWLWRARNSTPSAIKAQKSTARLASKSATRSNVKIKDEKYPDEPSITVRELADHPETPDASLATVQGLTDLFLQLGPPPPGASLETKREPATGGGGGSQ